MRRHRFHIVSPGLIGLLFACTGATTDPAACPETAPCPAVEVAACDGPPCECAASDARDDGAADTASPDVCTALEADRSAENLASLRRFALYRATAVVEGTLGEITVGEAGPMASFAVTTVHRGWRFLEGLEVSLSAPAGLEPSSSGASTWVVALSQPHPSSYEHAPHPWWGNALTFVPSGEAGPFADVTGYHADAASHVAIVRIAAQDAYRTTFEVVDALKGSFPPTFSDNWYAEWGLPYPGPSTAEGPAPAPEKLYVASVMGLTHYPAPSRVEGPQDDVWIGSVLDFRPADAAEIAAVSDAIAHPAPPYDRDRLRATRDALTTGYRFHRSALVVEAQVTGRADECCTGAGGTFVQFDTLDTLKGDPVGRFVLGGHAYYGTEECGDGLLVGLDARVDPAAIGEGFDCLQYPAGDSWEAYAPGISSPERVRLPLTVANRARVAGWLAASPPLYQLYETGAEVPVAALTQDPTNAPWTTLHDAFETLAGASVLVLFTIDQVDHDAANDAYRVTASSTFSLAEYEHLARHTFQLAFRCGDPRLLEVGSRWVGGLVMLEPYGYDPTGKPNLAEAFLIPGALFPEDEVTGQLANEFYHRAIASNFRLKSMTPPP